MAPVDQSGLSYRHHFPLLWEPLARCGGDPVLQDRENVEALQTILLLEYGIVENAEHENRPTNPELQRLEKKIDLLVRLLSRLLMLQQTMPAPVEVILGSQTIAWPMTQVMVPGSFLRLSIHLSSLYPLPLRLDAVVLDSVEREQGLWLRAAYQGMSDNLRNELTRLIFLFHRRQIAHRKKGE